MLLVRFASLGVLDGNSRSNEKGDGILPGSYRDCRTPITRTMKNNRVDVDFL